LTMLPSAAAQDPTGRQEVWSMMAMLLEYRQQSVENPTW
jgi:hypothetical protein